MSINKEINKSCVWVVTVFEPARHLSYLSSWFNLKPITARCRMCAVLTLFISSLKTYSMNLCTVYRSTRGLQNIKACGNENIKFRARDSSPPTTGVGRLLTKAEPVGLSTPGLRTQCSDWRWWIRPCLWVRSGCFCLSVRGVCFIMVFT